MPDIFPSSILYALLDARYQFHNIGPGFATKTLMDADLNYNDGTVVYVTNDATSGNNGLYRKSGASGAGEWIQSSYDRVAIIETVANQLKSGLSLTSPNLLDENALVAGWIDYTNGVEYDTPGFKSGYIAVTAGIDYHLRSGSYGGTSGWACYNSSHVFTHSHLYTILFSGYNS